MNAEDIVFVMSVRVELLKRALGHGHITEAGFQLDRLDALADRLQYGVPISRPEHGDEHRARAYGAPTYVGPEA